MKITQVSKLRVLKMILFLFLIVYVCVCVGGICMSQVPLEVLDPLELQLEVVESCLIWVLTIELLFFQEQ